MKTLAVNTTHHHSTQKTILQCIKVLRVYWGSLCMQDDEEDDVTIQEDELDGR